MHNFTLVLDIQMYGDADDEGFIALAVEEAPGQVRLDLRSGLGCPDITVIRKDRRSSEKEEP